MKKFIIILLAMVFMSSMVCAEGSFWKGIFIDPAPKKKAEPAPPINTVLGSLPLNLNGDTIYLASDKSFGAGVGIDLATYKGIVTLRGETIGTSEASLFAGVGLMVNIPALVNLAGANWNASYINPSIGVIPGYNFGTRKGDVGIVLSILQVTF